MSVIATGAVSLKQLPPGLTCREVASRLKIPYHQARFAIAKARYHYTDGRIYGQMDRKKFDPAQADWTQTNAEIARQFKVSRELIRRIRSRLKISKPSRKI